MNINNICSVWYNALKYNTKYYIIPCKCYTVQCTMYNVHS